MMVWETMPVENEPPVVQDYAQIWRAAEKIVFSRTLTKASTPKTRIEKSFDPADIAKLKKESSRDIGIGGAELAGEAIKAGLVDENASLSASHRDRRGAARTSRRHAGAARATRRESLPERGGAPALSHEALSRYPVTRTISVRPRYASVNMIALMITCGRLSMIVEPTPLCWMKPVTR